MLHQDLRDHPGVTGIDPEQVTTTVGAKDTDVERGSTDKKHSL